MISYCSRVCRTALSSPLIAAPPLGKVVCSFFVRDADPPSCYPVKVNISQLVLRYRTSEISLGYVVNLTKGLGVHPVRRPTYAAGGRFAAGASRAWCANFRGRVRLYLERGSDLLGGIYGGT